MQKYLESLNASQLNAVKNVDGPSLVIAGAGSGKTRVLTYRIAYLLSQGIQPGKILALTFTNKAAKEMKDRIGNLVGPDLARYLWMGTFHSIFARILRKEGIVMGYDSNFTIYDTDDSKSLIRSIIRDLSLDDKTYKPGEVLSRISSAKNNLITAQAYFSNSQIQARDQITKRPRMADIYKLYAIRCKKAGAMDFDDLLLNTNILFRDFQDILKIYQQKYQYILVDEYQDTNYSQYLIVNKLGARHKNVCVVGDDAQSIYSFRGAKIENILNFKNDYPDHSLFKLEQNYRSTQTIVNAANSVIKKNKDQISKEVYSKNEIGNKINIIKSLTDNEEGFLVSNSILDTQHSERVMFSDFAILYRTNAQSRIFEEALRKRNIPYKVYGSLSFYQRKEIKDILAYFRLAINHLDDEALKRIINYPARGIGKTTLEKLEYAANEKEVSLWEIINGLKEHNPGLNKGTLGRITDFIGIINDAANKVQTLDAYDAAMNIASISGILKDLFGSESPEERSKYDNVEELLNGIRDFTEQNDEELEKVTLDKYMENVSLLTNADNEKDEDKNKVTIMTIHSAKGLEFGHVYIAGAEEELFPSRMAVESPKNMEEERRLFYVALTRAKTRATISYAQTRYKWGLPTDCRPSRFIEEIDSEFVSWPDKDTNPFLRKNNVFPQDFSDNEFTDLPLKKTYQDTPFDKRKLTKVSNISKSGGVPVNHIADPNFKPDPPEKIQLGMNVEHQRFGLGKIIHIEGEFPNKKATVYFQKIGQEKQLLLKFAKLRIVKTT
ncbi:MAG: UvrD-helicase domain-containing protein [Bacteroidales bacterium]|nr:UvrD-helicase domain-containing protein [Bacteroidales bacterium]